MKIKQQVNQVSSGTPSLGAAVTVQTYPGGILVGSGSTDAEGIATILAQGIPGDVRVRATRGGNYDVFSETIYPSGQFDADNLRLRLKYLVGNGVIGSYGGQFAATTGVGTITVQSGMVILDGLIASFPSATTVSVTNGDRALVAVLNTDTIILTEIDYAVLSGSVHVPLYRYTVSGGSVVGGTMQSIARLVGLAGSSTSVMDVARAASGSTTDAVGEDAGLSVTLSLDATKTYDIYAKASVLSSVADGAIAIEVDGTLSAYQSTTGAIQTRLRNASSKAAVSGGSRIVKVKDRYDSGGSSTWGLLATYGSTGSGDDNYNTPGQVTIDASGNVYVADTLNIRVIQRTSGGVFSAKWTRQLGWLQNGIPGVAIDSSSNIYVTSSNNYVASGTAASLNVDNRWYTSLGSTSRHCCTDGTYVYVTCGSAIKKVNASTGVVSATYGSAGSTDGKYSTPYGICTDGTHFWVVDSGNSRVQKITVGGVYVSQFAIPSGCRGIARDSSGNLLVANYSGNAVRRYTSAGAFMDSFTVTAPDGVAVDASGNVWVSSVSGNNLQKWGFLPPHFDWVTGLLTAIAVPR